MENKKYKLIDGEKYALLDEKQLNEYNIIQLENNHYNVVANGQSINCKVLATDLTKKVFKIAIGSEVYNISIKNPLEQRLEQLGFATQKTKKVNELRAPMPGLVLDTMVKKDDVVNTGDILLILEAMKMENVLKASHELEVAEVLVKKGDAVDKGQLLMKFK